VGRVNRMRTRSTFLVAVLTLAVVVTACSGSSNAADDTTTTAPTTTAPVATTAPSSVVPTTAAAPPTTETATSAPATGGCRTGTPNAVPAGATHQTTLDLDGDGKPDTLWLDAPKSGGERMGVVTAAGGGSTIDLSSASPIPESAFVVDADGKAPLEILTSDGRVGGLYAFVDCSIQVVKDVKGQPYRFDLGFGDYGTGVGCTTVDGVRYLTGLHALSDDGTTVKWTRTEILLDGLTAKNGKTQSGTFTHPSDDGAINLLHTLSCGQKTIEADGITVPE